MEQAATAKKPKKDSRMVVRLDHITKQRLTRLKEAYRATSLSHAFRLAIEDAEKLIVPVQPGERV